MMKKGQINKALKSRFFRLRHGVLYYYKDQKSGNATSADLNHIGSLACRDMKLQIEDVPMNYKGQTLYAFTVLAKGQDSSKWRVLECACQSERERITWTDKLSAAIAVAQMAEANTPSLDNDPSTRSSNSGKGKRQSVILEAHGQPASNIYRCLPPLPQSLLPFPPSGFICLHRPGLHPFLARCCHPLHLGVRYVWPRYDVWQPHYCTHLLMLILLTTATTALALSLPPPSLATTTASTPTRSIRRPGITTSYTRPRL